MRILPLVLAVVFLAGSSLSSHAEDEKKEELSHCLKSKVKGHGFPNKMRSVANMNAIIQWMAAIRKKHGEEYSQWHTAMDSKVDCRNSGSNLYICVATGLPCKPQHTAQK